MKVRREERNNFRWECVSCLLPRGELIGKAFKITAEFLKRRIALPH
jgi:hypothetical protein